jgi:Domain of unknown function (DUF5060)/Protein of unknown function (DUF4038)
MRALACDKIVKQTLFCKEFRQGIARHFSFKYGRRAMLGAPRWISAFVVAAVSLLIEAGRARSETPVYAIAEMAFHGPPQTAASSPARDVQLAVTFRHQGGKEIQVQGFFDGDGNGGIEGDIFKVRFCPTLPGKWTLEKVESNAPELAGQHRGDVVTATASALHGFWLPDQDNAGGRWYQRSDGSHPYIIGNTHYTFLTECGPDEKPTGGHIADDIVANAKFFRKLRFGLQGCQYPHPTEKPWLDDNGQPSDDGNYSHRPNPRWFHQRVDLAVSTAFEHDLIADLIICGSDGVAARSTLKAEHNGGDATPWLRYIAARYGSFPNAWICLCNEYDIKTPNYTPERMAEVGMALRKLLPYPTPVSVHDGAKAGWSAKFDALPEWADHQIIQKKTRIISSAADAIDFVARGANGTGPRHKPTVDDELSYQGAGDKHNEGDTLEALLGVFLGGGYGTTGEKHGNKLGQYFWGKFDPTEHSAADKLRWLRELIDQEITFWKMSPDTAVFENLQPRFRGMAWKEHEYLLGTDSAASGLVANLPPGHWTVTRHDVAKEESKILTEDAVGRFLFDAPDSRAVIFHFKVNGGP